MPHLLSSVNKIPLDPSVEGMDHSLGMLHAATGMLLHTVGANESATFSLPPSHEGRLYPSVPENPARFTAQRTEGVSWHIVAYLARPYSNPFDVTMSNADYVFRQDPESVPLEIARLSRDFYVRIDPSGLFRESKLHKTALRAPSVLKALGGSMYALSNSFDSMRDAWEIL